jgi:hypothetical protein
MTDPAGWPHVASVLFAEAPSQVFWTAASRWVMSTASGDGGTSMGCSRCVSGSDASYKAPTFFDLHDRERVTAEQIDDFVSNWHDSGDDEQRSLAEYLGMTDLEYSAFFVTPRAIPYILAARGENRPLPELMASL